MGQNPIWSGLHKVFLESLRTIISQSQFEGYPGNEDKLLTPTDYGQPFSRKVIEPIMIRRIIDEFVSTQDRSIIPLLNDLLGFPDMDIRVRSIKAFQDFPVRTA